LKVINLYLEHLDDMTQNDNRDLYYALKETFEP
jgi:hypothetical protein